MRYQILGKDLRGSVRDDRGTDPAGAQGLPGYGNPEPLFDDGKVV